MSKIKVIPVYGWGWSEGESTIETPAPFLVDVVRSEIENERYKALFGAVTTDESRYAGCSVIMVFRNFSTYDVLVYKEISERDVPANWYPENVKIFATGFAEIVSSVENGVRFTS